MSFLEYDFRVPAGTRGLYSRARAKSGPGPIQKLRARVPENPWKTARAGSGSGRSPIHHYWTSSFHKLSGIFVAINTLINTNVWTLTNDNEKIRNITKKVYL